MNISCISLIVSIISALAAIGAIITTKRIDNRQKKDKHSEAKKIFLRQIRLLKERKLLSSWDDIAFPRFSPIVAGTSPLTQYRQEVQGFFHNYQDYEQFENIFNETIRSLEAIANKIKEGHETKPEFTSTIPSTYDRYEREHAAHQDKYRGEIKELRDIFLRNMDDIIEKVDKSGI